MVVNNTHVAHIAFWLTRITLGLLLALFTYRTFSFLQNDQQLISREPFLSSFYTTSEFSWFTFQVSTSPSLDSIQWLIWPKSDTSAIIHLKKAHPTDGCFSWLHKCLWTLGVSLIYFLWKSHCKMAVSSLAFALFNRQNLVNPPCLLNIIQEKGETRDRRL